jgi:hypothetical protein
VSRGICKIGAFNPVGVGKRDEFIVGDIQKAPEYVFGMFLKDEDVRLD